MVQQYKDPFAPFWELAFVRLVLYWKGSIFQFIWIEFSCVVGLFAGLLGLWYNRLEDYHEDEINEGLESLERALGYVHSRYQAALSMILGFYTSTIFSRWWNARRSEGAAQGAVQDLAMQVAVLVTEPKKVVDEPKKEQHGESNGITAQATSAGDIRLHLVRWLNLSHALVVGELYEKDPIQFSTFEKLMDVGLLTQGEYEYMPKTKEKRFVAPLVWFLNTLRQLRDKKTCGVTDSTMMIMSKHVSLLRGSLGGLALYKSQPVPLFYRQLVNLTVRVNMIIVVLYVSLQDITADDDIGFSKQIWYLLIPFSFEYFVFVGWLLGQSIPLLVRRV